MSDQPPQPPQPQRPSAYFPRLAGTYLTLSIIVALGGAMAFALSIYFLLPQAALLLSLLLWMLGMAISLRLGFLIVHHRWPRFGKANIYLNGALACGAASSGLLALHFEAVNAPDAPYLFAVPMLLMFLIIAAARDRSRR